MFSWTSRLNQKPLFLEFSGFYILFSFQGSWCFRIERRRRDLNPRAATNDLLPFQGSPFNLLGTSAGWFSYLMKLITVFETERVGFEPTRPFGQTVFKTASLWPLRYLSKRACLLYYSFWSLSRGFLNFFIFLCCDVLRSPATLIVYHVHFQMSTSFFYFFYFLFFPVFLDYQNRKSSGLVAFSIDQYFPSNRAPRLPDPPE